MKKSLISLTVIGLFFFTTINLTVYAQKKRSDKCKYFKDNVNDFTKKRTIVTEGETVIDVKKGGFGLSVQDVLDASVRVFINVLGNNVDGINGLEFQWGSTKYGFIGQFDQVDLLLENGEIISLKDEEHSESTKNDSWYFELKTYSIADDSIWNRLKNIPIKKLRLLINGEELRNVEIDKMNVTSIMKVINCIDVLGIPKSKTSLAPNKSDKNSVQTKDTEKNLFETIKPLGNNGTISIYKQWKSITRLDKEGIPVNQGNDITQFFEDGTYKSFVKQNGKITALEGKFSMISDNKIMVFYLDNGGTYSCVIKKLSSSELEIKSDDYTIIYSVY